MSSEKLERNQEVLVNGVGFIASNFPVHFAGMGVFMRNDSANDATVEIHESADGITWNLVLFSSPAASGLPSLTMVGLSFGVVLFVSDQNYIRIRIQEENHDGVYCSLVQYPPKSREPAIVY
jgi:hypothetical protein